MSTRSPRPCDAPLFFEGLLAFSPGFAPRASSAGSGAPLLPHPRHLKGEEAEETMKTVMSHLAALSSFEEIPRESENTLVKFLAEIFRRSNGLTAHAKNARECMTFSPS